MSRNGFRWWWEEGAPKGEGRKVGGRNRTEQGEGEDLNERAQDVEVDEGVVSKNAE